MSYRKTFICLANSRKPPQGRCIAGREIDAGRIGPWIRLVSARPSREVSLEERRFADGCEPDVLDVIRVACINAAPDLYQSENHIIDNERCWRRLGSLTWQELLLMVEHPKRPLWANGESSRHGTNDRVAEHVAATFHRSLCLIKPLEVTLVVAPETSEQTPARRRVRAAFELAGSPYCLSVTDPPIESQYLRKPDGVYILDEAILCVSLSEPFHGFAYKLAASVITPQRRSRS